MGTYALQKTGEQQFELIKMGVLDIARGRKAGETLLRAVIARAAELGSAALPPNQCSLPRRRPPLRKGWFRARPEHHVRVRRSLCAVRRSHALRARMTSKCIRAVKAASQRLMPIMSTFALDLGCWWALPLDDGRPTYLRR